MFPRKKGWCFPNAMIGGFKQGDSRSPPRKTSAPKPLRRNLHAETLGLVSRRSNLHAKTSAPKPTAHPLRLCRNLHAVEFQGKEFMTMAIEPKVGIAGFGMVGVENTYVVGPAGGTSLSGEDFSIICVE